MVTEKMIEAARSAVILGEDADGKPVYLSGLEARAALEAALSAVETVETMDEEDRTPMPAGLDPALWQKADEIHHAMALVAHDQECVKIIYAALSTDAEPVAWMITETKPSGSKCWKVVEHEHQAREEAKSWSKLLDSVTVSPLYAAPPAPSVAVKALEWRAHGGGIASALGAFGEDVAYAATEEGWRRFSGHWNAASGLAEAKAAAQADYEARIQSALSAQVQDVATAQNALQAIANLPTGDNLDVCQGHEEAYRAVEKLFSVPPQVQVQDVAAWQDISTAPKDGSEILLYREDCGVILGRWISCCDFVVDGDPSAEFCQSDDEWEEPDWFGADFVSGFRITNDGLPTHWMPLPAAPAAKQGEGE